MTETRDYDQDDGGMSALGRALRISFNLLVLVMIGSLFFFLWRSLFVVESKEVGLLFRFGKVVSENGKAVLGEGPHFAWPYPIDKQVTVPTITQTVSIDDLWYDDKEKKLFIPGKDGYILTGDNNVLHNRWTLRYRVVDPLSYTLQFSDETVRKETLKALLRNAIVNVSSSVGVDTLYSDRETYRQDVRKTFVTAITDIHAGIEIEQLAFEWAAPRRLKDAFESVTNAKERSNNEVFKAQGDVQKLLAETSLRTGEDIAKAEIEKAATISGASADAAVFEKLYEQYKRHPDLFKKLYFDERLKGIIKNLADVYVIDKRSQRTLYLELNPERKKKTDGPNTK